MDRRTFIKTVELAGAGALCSGLPLALTGCTGLRYVPYARTGNRLVVQRADFGDGPYALLENPQLPRAIYLHRLEADTFSAVLMRCMHQGCEVEPAGDRLACPCHGSQYTHTGEVLRGPTERPLFRYRVTTDADHIYIELPDPGVL